MNLFLSLMICLLCLLSQAVSAGSLQCRTERRGPFPLVIFNAENALKLSTSLPIGRSVFNQSYHYHRLVQYQRPSAAGKWPGSFA